MTYELPTGIGGGSSPVQTYSAPNQATYVVGTLNIKTVGDITANHGVKVLVYGRPGFGKTRLIGTTPRPFIFSTEGGLLSLRQNFSHIPCFEIHNVAELEQAHAWTFNSSEAKSFDTICLDSISEIAEVCLISEKKANVKNGFAAYGNLNDRIMQIFRDFRDHAHKHVYFVAKEEYDKDQDGTMKYQPSMPGKTLSIQVPYMFDEIFRCEQYRDTVSGQVIDYLRCKADNNTIAKDRSGRLDWAEQMDLGMVFNKILAP
jgi:hypothetical protein